MRVEKIKNEDVMIFDTDLVKMKKAGPVTEVMYAQKRNFAQTIQKLDKDHYVLMSDIDRETGEIVGEVREIQHNESRACDMRSVARSIGNLRDLINCNCVYPDRLKWITGTYRQREDMDSEPVPMRDPVRLYKDFERFVKKLRYKYTRLGYQIEYIVAMEPQGSGSWHFHLILIFDRTAPFIPNDEIAKMWGQGFTQTQALDGSIDNLGAYLSAYLGDMSLDEYARSGLLVGGEPLKDVDGKKYVKGARLRLYPPGFNLYRASRGVIKPEIVYKSWKSAKKDVRDAALTYEKSRLIIDDETGYENRLNYKYYNSNRACVQDDGK